MRWRSMKHRKPPRGRQLLVYDAALRGKRDVLDDGVRLGYFDGLRLRAAGEEPGEYLHWYPYEPPPRLHRQPTTVLTGEMHLLLDKLRTAYRRGELPSSGVIEPGVFNAKLPTLRALVRRGVLRQTPEGAFALMPD